MTQLQALPNLISYPITAALDTALCVGAGGSTGALADKPIVRNADRNLLIPASQVKGRLRHECEKLARGLGWAICESPNPKTMCPGRVGVSGRFDRAEYQVRQHRHCLVCQIFGNPVLSSRLIVDDFICQEEPANLTETMRPGVTLNRRRRTTEEQKLFFLETSPATQLFFSGHLHLKPNLSDRPDPAIALLWAAFRHIHALGGSKSSGLGWLTWNLPETMIDESVWQFLARGRME